MNSVSFIRHLIPFGRSQEAKPPSDEGELVQRIREASEQMRGLRDGALKDCVAYLRTQSPEADSPRPDVVVAAFALCSEALRRTRGIVYFDVQLLAGLALIRSTVAEMQTGEGKTLAAALPAFTHSLARPVHAMTVNVYLAHRDYELLLPVYDLLGVSTGLVRPGDTSAGKRAAYACEITYGPGYEFGFDFLRDQLAQFDRTPRRLGETYRDLLRGRNVSTADFIQRGHGCAIVDEADSVMIDEAVTPLVLAAQSSQLATHPSVYAAAVEMADRLDGDRDYVLESATRQLFLTPEGRKKIQGERDRIPRDGLLRPWPQYVEQGLRAKLTLKRDVDYVVKEKRVQLVDEHTGRIFADRSWRDGLRQAVEAREGVPVTAENETAARVSRQRYLGLYDRLCGLTGTAAGSEREFWDVYRLPVVSVPLRMPTQRTALPLRCFADPTSKWGAIASAIGLTHREGRPTLVGTRTILDSESLAQRLDAQGVPYRLLNGKQDDNEARIIARAGEPGVVTLATNLAGRGTDIKLTDESRRLGGLHVIGCEPNASVRVDRQLVGRAARQGDPGSSQFFVSASDALIAANAPRLARRIRRLSGSNGEVVGDLAPDVARLQQRLERRQAAARRQLMARDRWVEDVMSELCDRA